MKQILPRLFKFTRSSRKKAILIGLSIIVVLVSISALILYWPKSAQAAWFDDNWAYRKAITVTVASSASDITSLETLLTIDTTGITTKMQAACQDIRFTNVSGKLLPYFIDSCSNNSATNKVWVLVDLVPKNTTTYTLYMYYGNPGTSSLSNSALFYDVNGLLGYWTMNDASWTNNCSTTTVTDSSVNGTKLASCPNTTGPTTPASGNYSTSAAFNGTSQYFCSISGGVCASTSLFNLSSNLTVSAWVFQTSASNYNGVITKTPDNGSTGYDFGIFAGKVSFFINNAGCNTGNITLNTWTHIVGVYDGTNAIAYINGVEACRGAASTLSTTTGPLAIGGRFAVGGPNNTSYFHGSIDDARLYNRAFSPTEVSNLYSSPNNITTAATATSQPSTSFASEEKGAGPTFYSKLDEGYGTTTQDSTKNGITGTLSGSPTPTWQTEDMCMNGKCLFFNGTTGYVNYGTPSALTGSTQISVSFWAKPSTISVDTGFINNHQSGTDTDGSWEMRIDTSGILTFQLDGVACSSAKIYQNGLLTSSYTQVGNFSTAISSVALAANTWSHIEGTASGCSSLQMPHNLVIGYKELNVSGNPANFYQGFMDDVKIYNYERTAAQVKSDYVSRGSSKGSSATLGANNQNLAALSNGLVGYWKMDESSGNASDSSGNAYTLTNNNTTPYAVGKFGNAGSFTAASSNYFNVSDNSNLSVGSGKSISVSAWVNITDKSTFRAIVGKYVASGNQREYVLAYSQASDRFSFTVSPDGTSSSLPVVNADDLGSPSTSTWYFVTAWYDAIKGTLNIQVNDLPPNTISDTTGVFDGTADFTVGAYNGGTSFWNGKIDSVRVYNRALTNTEVTFLYNWVPGPVGWWKMDERTGTTTADSSGNGLTGTLTTSPAWTTGKVGAGIDLSPTNSYVSVNDNSALDITGDITYEIWAKPKVIDGTTRIVMGKAGSNGSSTTRQYSMRLNTSNQWAGFVYSGSTTYSVTDATTVPSTTRWDHIAIVRDSTAATLKIYTNGVLMKISSSITGNLNTPANILAIGREGINSSSYFGGYVDDLRIYNYVRNSGQIIQDMNSGGPAERNPIGYWKMDEGYGTTTNDSSGNGNNLTLSGSTKPSWTNSGKFGKALSFGGSNAYLAAGSDVNTFKINSTDSVSLSAWINLTNVSSQHDIICKYTGTASTSSYCLTVNSSGKLQMLVTNSTGPANVTTTGNATLATATWYHVVGVFSSANSVTLYINGVQDKLSTSSIPSTLQNPTTILDIGGENAGSNLMNGTIDEAKVFNYALSPLDVQEDYNQSRSEVLGVLGTNTSYTNQAANQEYCIPGDATSCTAPVGEWKFEEGTGTSVNDTSGNGFVGTWNGTGTQWSQGKFGKAGKFNGSDSFVDMGNQSSLNATTTFTVSAWIKRIGDSQSANGVAGTVAQKWISAGSTGWFIEVTDSDQSNANQIRFFISGVSDTSLFSGTSGTISNNIWTQVTVVYDGVNKYIYLNGNLAASEPTTGTPTTTTNPFRIGFGNGSSTFDNYFNGLIDQVRFYNRALSPAQIAYDYNQGKPVAQYKFDECQGTIAHDASGNGNNATITIAGSGTQTAVGTCNTASTAWGNGATGKFNSSLNFDGNDDYAVVADNNALKFGSNDFSISTWIKTSTSTSQYIAEKDINGCTNASWLLGTGINTAGKAYAIIGTTSTSCGQESFESTTTVSDGNWHNIVMVRHVSGTNQLYVDGRLEATLADQGGSTTNTQPLTIAAQDNDSGTRSGFFNGQLDDLRFYNYALTGQQITNVYNQGAAVRYGPTTGTP